MKSILEYRKNEEGFSLTELLVVIVVLGVLAGIVLFAVGGINDKGQASSCEADKKTVETAQETYNAKNDGYAKDVKALVTAKLLRSPSKWYQTNSTGAVTPIKGNPGKCT